MDKLTLSDEELDRDWKPNGRRPQSTIARSFSAELMDIFKIENSVADLDKKVDKRKQEIDSRTAELQALEARLKEMDDLLRRRVSPPNSTGAAAGSSGSGPRHARTPVAGAFDAPPEQLDQGEQTQQQQQQQQSQVHEDGTSKYGSRPGTARASRQAVPGALPPTPTESEDGDRERAA